MHRMTSVYIHWPFCLSKCSYCNFNSYPLPALDESAWATAYLKELESFNEVLREKTVQTIYFGGGTPSLMPIRIIEQILEKISMLANVALDAEITLEANPTSSQQCRLASFKQAGINRVSLGLQALNDADLKFLGRTHSCAEGLAALERVQSLFENHSCDLIYARPNQVLKAWKEEIKTAIKYTGPHISLYQLTIEKRTKLYQQMKGRLKKLVNQDLALQMHDYATTLLQAHGLERYEISNYAKSGYESRHNLAYWNYDEYIGIGPGAHGRIHEAPGRFVAIQSENNPVKWLINSPAKRKILTKNQAAAEYILMNLRKASGISIKDFSQKFGLGLNNFLDFAQMQLLIDSGYIKCNPEQIFATARGKKFVDNIACRILFS